MKKNYLIPAVILFLFSCAGIPEPASDIELPGEFQSGIESEISDSTKEFNEESEIDEPYIAEHELDEPEVIDEFDELNIEEYIIEAAESYDEKNIEEDFPKESDSIDERIEDLHKMVLDLQEQLAQLTEQAQQQPPPAPPVPIPAPVPQPAPPVPSLQTPPPAVPPVVSALPAQEPALQQEPPAAETSVRMPPPPLPPVRETQQALSPAQSIITPNESDIVFSRVVRATAGQFIEIPFRGTGWVYLGELASRRGIAYDSRRNDPDGLSFIFKAEEAGTYALKFSRHDFIRDYILNDHVQVIVGPAPAASAGWFSPPIERDRVIAQPRWPSVSEEAGILRGGTRPDAARADSAAVSAGTTSRQPETASGSPLENGSVSGSATTQGSPSGEPANISEVIQGTAASGTVASGSSPPRAEPPNLPVYEPPDLPTVPQVASSASTGQSGAGEDQIPVQPAQREEAVPVDQLVQRARETFEAGNVAGAIALLDRYKEIFPSGTDELYWLYGQFYEANSPSRNILLSLDYYKRLTSEFPQSARFNDARRRIAYLERFYINIR